MTDEELERRLRAWYRDEIAADEMAPTALRSKLATIPQASPASSRRSASRRGVTLLAAAALVGLVAGTAVVGGFLTPHPGPVVLPSQLPSAALPSSALPSAEPSTATTVAGRIVHTRWRMLTDGQEDCKQPAAGFHCFRASIFTSSQDGSDERELFPGPRSEVITSSTDGSRLIIRMRQSDGDPVYLTDIDGSEPQLLDTKCQFPCVGDWGFAFSPDGSRLAFARSIGGDPALPADAIGSVIAIMDMATGAVVELDSTFASNPDLGDPCHGNCGEGEVQEPSWSPDGSHLLYSRVGIGIPNKPLDAKRHFLDKAVFVVDADGGNLRQLVPIEIFAIDARWSPDASSIVFTSVVDTVTTNPPDNWQQLNDIYTVRPDGTGLRRLTTDTVGPVGTTEPGEFGARYPTWTRDGHIVFTRNAEQGDTTWQLWVMDRDGSNVTRLDPSDPAQLTAIGCVSCPYPGVDGFITYPSIAFWIPAR